MKYLSMGLEDVRKMTNEEINNTIQHVKII